MVWPFPSSVAAPAQGIVALPSEARVPTSQTPKDVAPPASNPLSREEIAEKELQSFLAEITADVSPSSTKYLRVSESKSSKTSNSKALPTSESDLSLSDQLLPTTMSCRDAFDAAFYCNSMGGQFNNLYRYGTVRSCSDSWNDFWFCMRTRQWGEPEKGNAIRERHKIKEKVKYDKREGGDIGRSSEDVWKSRERKVEVGEAMSKPFIGFPSDEEFNRIVREERRRVHGESTGT
ncbi:hypothetical protein BJ878DRAFT_411597 [Calycina marina]|uniref:Early meiotic induction protein 1 n=1 Tax=Calycina marina TaxID=1763456 RepID=A0A9P8CKT4_9HELO|nr:hypothetical protein BJ878DRAFT_411597 [Calycina marina]